MHVFGYEHICLATIPEELVWPNSCLSMGFTVGLLAICASHTLPAAMKPAMCSMANSKAAGKVQGIRQKGCWSELSD